jgi:hypothetical protein
MIAFGTTLMEPILAATQPPITLLVVYVALNEINKRPYDILYWNAIVLPVSSSPRTVTMIV